MFDIPYPKRRGSLHDQVFKDLLGAFLPELVTLVAPELATRLLLNSWTLLDKETFTDWPKGKRREVDLLARVALADGRRTALIHVEIEARYRQEIGRRLAGYYMQIRLRHNLPVVSIALCLRGGPPGISLGSVLDADLGTTANHFHYHLFCLEGSRAEDFLARDQPLGWALAALMRPESLSRAEHKMACLQRIAGAPLNDLRRFLLVNCVETYLQLTGRDAEELAALQARGNAEEVPSMGTRRLTWAEQFEEKGWKKGVETGWNKGVERGVETGVEVGVRQTLLRLLGARFGPLSDDVKRRVEAIHSVDRLSQIAEHLLVARSLEEIDLRQLLLHRQRDRPVRGIEPGVLGRLPGACLWPELRGDGIANRPPSLGLLKLFLSAKHSDWRPEPVRDSPEPVRWPTEQGPEINEPVASRLELGRKAPSR